MSRSDIRPCSCRHGRRLVLSFAYFWLGMFCTAATLVLVQERVPSPNRYPPLPDIILEHVPAVPWAYHVAEYTIMTYTAVMLVTVCLHRYRSVVARRYFVLTGSVYLLRAACIGMTQLSRPRTFELCPAIVYLTTAEKVRRALQILGAGGLRINGANTCGDYIFSGHAASLTMAALFIAQYTSRSRVIIAVCGLSLAAALSAILVGHDHYSIDVFIAVLLVFFSFQAFHLFVDHQAIEAAVFGAPELRWRAKLCFPVMYYFEVGCTCTVRNEAQFPLALTNLATRFRALGCWKQRLKWWCRELSKGKSTIESLTV